MPDHLDSLKERLRRVHDLRSAAAVLSWDQETYMPPGGAEARSSQLATLSELGHEVFASAETGELLEAAGEEVADLEPGSDEASIVRVVGRDWERATRLPASLVAEIARVTSRAQHVWRRAREDDDFESFRPWLERIVGLQRDKAEALGYDEHLYDPLLDEYEPDMRTSEVAAVFARLRSDLVPIVEAIADRTAAATPADDVLARSFDRQAQWEFGVAVLEDFGFDFERGRQDLSTHPFSTGFSVGDVRITTRVHEDWLPAALFGTLHECGHALYEQGVDPGLEGTLLADGTSLGMHESQSRLWENLVGRSRPFWEHYFPKLVAAFPEPLADVSLDEFYRAANRVEPSLIRVEADEVTYNLHVMLRFELELALLEDDLPVAELPGAWRDKMDEFLGVVPDDDRDGVLQDIHWSMGGFGYFPTYTLGNLISAQLFARIREDIADLDERIAAGEFGELLGWLRRHVHRHGRKFTAGELLERITGGGLEADSWLRYVRHKFGDLYGELP